MQLLYRAIACKELDGKNILFPGYLFGSQIRELKPGDKIKVQRRDGALLETTVQGVASCIFDEYMMEKLALRVTSGYYLAIEVPQDFNETGDVYLIDQ